MTSNATIAALRIGRGSLTNSRVAPGTANTSYEQDLDTTTDPQGNSDVESFSRDAWNQTGEWTLTVGTSEGNGTGGVSVNVASSGGNASSGFVEVTVEAAYLAEYFFWLQSVADPETETPPVASYSTLTTTEKFSDVSSFSTNTVTISGGDGGEDFDVDFSGAFNGGSSQQTIVEELEIKAGDSVIVNDKTETLINSHNNSGAMEIDVTGSFGGGNSDFSGTFEMHMTMATDSGGGTHEVRENGVLVERYNVVNHGTDNDYTLSLDLNGTAFSFEFDADGGNSMSGTTVKELYTQTTTARKKTESSHDYVLILGSRTIEAGGETVTRQHNGTRRQWGGDNGDKETMGTFYFV